jgi:hypothetical protein
MATRLGKHIALTLLENESSIISCRPMRVAIQ